MFNVLDELSEIELGTQPSEQAKTMSEESLIAWCLEDLATPMDTYDCGSEDCERQLASQPANKGAVWHIPFHRQQIGQVSVEGLCFSSLTT